MKTRGRLTLVLALAALTFGVFASIAGAELTESGDLFVRFRGGITPNALPRKELAPIAVKVAGTVKTLSGERPPSLRQMKIELNRGGVLDSRGLPTCRYSQLQATTPSQALAACGGALVGSGAYAATIAFPEQSSFPSVGRILAFNARRGGQDQILAHVYGTEPVPITRVLVFHIHRTAGTFGTVITANLSESVNHYGYVTALYLNLFRRYEVHGQMRSYISAQCAAPAGIGIATFPFARASMTFEDGRQLSSTLTRSCRVAG
jgi:hypothetical protein